MRTSSPPIIVRRASSSISQLPCGPFNPSKRTASFAASRPWQSPNKLQIQPVLLWRSNVAAARQYHRAGGQGKGKVLPLRPVEKKASAAHASRSHKDAYRSLPMEAKSSSGRRARASSVARDSSKRPRRAIPRPQDQSLFQKCRPEQDHEPEGPEPRFTFGAENILSHMSFPTDIPGLSNESVADLKKHPEDWLFFDQGRVSLETCFESLDRNHFQCEVHYKWKDGSKNLWKLLEKA